MSEDSTLLAVYPIVSFTYTSQWFIECFVRWLFMPQSYHNFSQDVDPKRNFKFKRENASPPSEGLRFIDTGHFSQLLIIFSSNVIFLMICRLINDNDKISLDPIPDLEGCSFCIRNWCLRLPSLQKQLLCDVRVK